MSTTAIAPLPTFATVSDTLKGLQEAVQALNSLITNFNPGGVSETILEAVAQALGSDASTVTAGRLTGAFELLTQVQNAAFILTAQGQALDYKCADVGVTRKRATAASTAACIQYTSTSGPVAQDTVIAIGSLVAMQNPDPTQSPIVYRLTTAATVKAGQSTSSLASATCTVAGSIGNAQVVGAINTVVSGASGFSVTNVIPVSGGQDKEQDDYPNGGLRARGLAAIPNASQCTVAAIKAAAVSYAGITSAAVLDCTDNDGVTFMRGKVQVYCDDGSGNLGATTTTTNAFDIPAVGSSVNVAVTDATPFVLNAYVNISNGTSGFYGQVTSAGGTSPLTVVNQAVVSGNVGDTIAAGATVSNPNNAALTAFQDDLTTGKWRAAGTQVYAHGSIVQNMTVALSVDTNSDYVATEATVAQVLAAVQQAIYAYVNGIPIGEPVILAAIVEVAKAVPGVSNVLISTVLINGVNGDFGVNGAGVVTMPPNQTARCAALASVTVTNNATVPY